MRLFLVIERLPSGPTWISDSFPPFVTTLRKATSLVFLRDRFNLTSLPSLAFALAGRLSRPRAVRRMGNCSSTSTIAAVGIDQYVFAVPVNDHLCFVKGLALLSFF